jgi:hypothetical protein
MLKLLPLPLLLATLLAAALAGCGGSDEPEEESATPAEAVAEIRTIKTMLADAVTQVRAGDADLAEETVGDAYLEHFEHVEGPLGERDHELMEELEEAISTDLRRDIADGQSADELEDAVDDISDDLDRAVEALER